MRFESKRLKLKTYNDKPAKNFNGGKDENQNFIFVATFTALL